MTRLACTSPVAPLASPTRIEWTSSLHRQARQIVKDVSWAECFGTSMTDWGAEIGIALADARQGRGLGKELMQALIHKAEEKQLEELMLNVY